MKMNLLLLAMKSVVLETSRSKSRH